MEAFLIKGGRKLQGSVRVGGAKNASYKLMIASLLSDGETTLENLPRINDVEITRQIIEDLGGQARLAGGRTVCINSQNFNKSEVPEKFGKDSRASSMFIAPLLWKFKQARIPLPGGDRIGARPLDRHFEGITAMGARLTRKGGMVLVTAPRLRGTRYRFTKNTHTGTETLILMAVLAEGVTWLENAAQEPEIDDLIALLLKMGAKITRLPNRVIKIEGVKRLHPASHTLMPDRNETVTYACAALATRGDLLIENAQASHLTAFLTKLKEAGGGYETASQGIRFFYKQPLRAVKLATQPYPGFMTDWQPLWAVLMTQARGQSLIHETVHNNRFQYAFDLKKMGAELDFYKPKVADPEATYNFNLADDRPEYFHGLVINGPTRLKAAKLNVHDLRAGATLVLASLIAQGTSRLDGISQIDRGYEDLDGQLIKLGARIRRL